MAPFVPFSPGVVGVILRFSSSGIPVEMTQGYKFFTGPATPVDGFALITIMNSWVTTSLMPLLNTSITSTGTVVNDLTSAFGWQVSSPDVHAGSVAGAGLPGQVAMTVTFESALRGRSQRGRNYVPGLSEADLLDLITFKSATVGAMDTAYDTLNTAAIGGGWTPVILSRFTGGVQRILGQTTPIATYRANQPIHTIRGRLT